MAPENQRVSVQETVSFQCRANGNPIPRIVWSFNGVPIPTVKGHYEISRQNTLYVHEVTRDDEGHYSCQAMNDVGSMTADASLSIDFGENKCLVRSVYVVRPVYVVRSVS